MRMDIGTRDNMEDDREESGSLRKSSLIFRRKEVDGVFGFFCFFVQDINRRKLLLIWYYSVYK